SPPPSQPVASAAAETVAPQTGSLSASVRSHLQQLSAAPRKAEPAPQLQDEIVEDEPEEKKPAPPRLKWMYVAAASIAALFLLGLALYFGSGGGPAVDVRQAEIRAFPPEAEILIDGEPCGVGECSAALEIGSHRATARLAGFEQEFQM